MFWGTILKPNTKSRRIVEKAFRVSRACLEFKKPEDSACVKVLYKDESEEGKDLEFILCYLDGKGTRQVSLDVSFERGEIVTFFTEGSGTVHLTGLMEEDEEEDSYSDDDDEAEESTTPQLVSKKRKGSEASPKQESPDAKRPRKVGAVLEESDEEDEEDSDFDPNAIPSDDDELGSGEEEEADSDDEMGEEDEDEDDLEFGSDDLESFDEDAELDDEDESPKEKATDKKKKQQDVVQKQKGTDKKPQVQGKKIDQTPSQNNQKGGKQNGEVAVNGEAKDSEKKKKKKNKKKNKQKEGQAADHSPAAKSPAAGGADGSKKPAENKGGVKIVTLKEGTGPVAKKGKAVHVYYRGRLQENNKEFDKLVEGKGFRFRLGAEEVIKGWDIGLDGMKVGEKRRLTVPPKLGYGEKGVPGRIPPNATLVFDVEMKAVS